jgi:hypothetical protein
MTSIRKILRRKWVELTGSDAASGDFYHEIHRGLYESLPPAGSVWPEAERQKWLAVAEASFKILYPSPKQEQCDAEYKPTIHLLAGPE